MHKDEVQAIDARGGKVNQFPLDIDELVRQLLEQVSSLHFFSDAVENSGRQRLFSIAEVAFVDLYSVVVGVLDQCGQILEENQSSGKVVFSEELQKSWERGKLASDCILEVTKPLPNSFVSIRARIYLYRKLLQLWLALKELWQAVSEDLGTWARALISVFPY